MSIVNGSPDSRSTFVWQLEPGDRIVRPKMPPGTVLTVVGMTRVRYDDFVRRLTVKSEVPGQPTRRCYLDLPARGRVLLADDG